MEMLVSIPQRATRLPKLSVTTAMNLDFNAAGHAFPQHANDLGAGFAIEEAMKINQKASSRKLFCLGWQ